MDDLDQFGLLAEDPPAQEPDGEPAPAADDADDLDVQEEAPAPEGTAPADDESDNGGTVSLARFREVNSALRRQEERVDELMRLLLTMRAQPGETEREPEIDPDVEASVTPVLDKRLREYEEVLRDHQHERQMAALEEVSPGIRAMWPQIKEAHAKLPEHLRREFDNMGGAIALRAQIEKQSANKPTQTTSAKRRAHTEAAPAGGGQRGRDPSRQDVMQMNRAEFEAFTESLRKRSGRADEGYDSLIR